MTGTDDRLDEIARRWSHDGGMGNSRGPEDYTDAGCRVLAECAWRDLDWLIRELRDARAEIERVRSPEAIVESAVAMARSGAESCDECLRLLFAASGILRERDDLRAELAAARAENERLKAKLHASVEEGARQDCRVVDLEAALDEARAEIEAGIQTEQSSNDAARKVIAGLRAELAAERKSKPHMSDDAYFSDPRVQELGRLAAERLKAFEAERAKVAKIRDWATADYGGAKTPAEVWPGLAALLGLAGGEQ